MNTINSDSTSLDKMGISVVPEISTLPKVPLTDEGEGSYKAPENIAKNKYDNLTPEELKVAYLKYHNERLSKFDDYMAYENNRACIEKAINFSGEPLMLPNFYDKEKDPNTENVFTIEPGEKLNFLNLFEFKQINRHRKNIKELLVQPGLYGFPKLLMVEDLNTPLPWPLVRKNVIDRAKEKGYKTVEMPVNGYDQSFMDVVLKEKKYNEKIMQRPGTGDLKDRPTQEEFEHNLSS